MHDKFKVPLNFRDQSARNPSYKLIEVEGTYDERAFVPRAKNVEQRLAKAVRDWVMSRKGTGWKLYTENSNRVVFRDLEAVYSEESSGLREFLSQEGIEKLTFSPTTLTQNERDTLGEELFDLDNAILPMDEA
jgi:hypothetical protein